jgi:hypothetical protein
MRLFTTVWKNRLRKFLDNPLAIIPFLKKRLYYNFVADSYIPQYKDFTFLSYEDTIDYIISNNASIVRFGDELFDMLEGIGLYYNNWRQKYDRKLAQRMKEVISSRDPRLLVCFNPELILRDRTWFKEQGIANQHQFWTNSKIFLKDYIHKGTAYGSALCFTPRYNKHIDFRRLKDHFSTKDVVIITSGIERFHGISLGRTTHLLEAPGSDAWQSYDRIWKELHDLIAKQGLSRQDTLMLISMGSAAKVLVFDLVKEGYTAWDTGQFFDLAFQEIRKLSDRP